MAGGAPHYLDIGQPIVPPAVVSSAPGNPPIDLTGATVVEVLLKRPGGVESTHTGSLREATQGLIQYDVVSEDLDEAGLWKMQAHVVLSDGSEYHGPVGQLYVSANLIGDTGIPEGVSSHATRHQEGGADPLRVETLPSDGTSGEVPIADGAGGLDMGTPNVEDLASAANANDFFAADGAGGIFTTGFDTLAASINLQGPKLLPSTATSTDHTLSEDDHFGTIWFTGTADKTLTIPTGVDSIITFVRNVGSGLVTISGGASITGATVLGQGDGAILLRRASNDWYVQRIGPPRLDTGTTITADYTITRTDHGKVYSIDSADPVTITVPDTLPPEHETYFDCVGAGDVTFAPSGTQSLVGPGTTAVQGATVGVLVRSATRAKLVGELS